LAPSPASGERGSGGKQARPDPRRGSNPNQKKIKPQSEEKVTLVSLPFCPAVSTEAHLLGIVGAEFVAKELTVWSTPRLQLSVHDRQAFSAKRATSCCVGPIEAFVHLLSLTPDQNAIPGGSVAYQSLSPPTVAKMTHI
jgi:hypothetical protein